jgi:hypothetical protein
VGFHKDATDETLEHLVVFKSHLIDFVFLLSLRRKPELRVLLELPPRELLLLD